MTKRKANRPNRGNAFELKGEGRWGIHRLGGGGHGRRWTCGVNSKRYSHSMIPDGAQRLERVELYTDSPARVRGEKGKTRIMYIEDKSGGLEGPARIGRVTFSKTGRTIYYRGMRLQSLKGAGFKSNYFDVESGAEYWVSGPKRNGQDGLYGGGGAEIDEDCRREYWTEIRGRPDLAERQTT